MNRTFIKQLKSGRLPRRQQGAITMFSAVLILILLTEMIIYAVHVGVFEQRKSSNEALQKEAFHIADSAVSFSKEYMLANAALIVSPSNNVFSDGSDGWLSSDGLAWADCATNLPDPVDYTHPCYAEPVAAFRDGMYFFSTDGSTASDLPINASGLLTGTDEDVTVQALLCMFDIDRDQDPIVQGCTTDTSKHDDRYFMITLLARGEADCNAGVCTAQSLIADKIGAFAPGGGEGGKAVPLVTKSTFPPTGTAEIVPNPNGGGPGVPVSAWLNSNSSCDGHTPVDASGGSWSTCERHEWYGVDIMPDDYKCPTANCSCGSNEKRLSYADGGDSVIGFDIVEDPIFPCNLFKYMLGVEKDAAGMAFIRSIASEIINDCSGLDEDSAGVIWVTGASCQVASNTQIGTKDKPVFLISAAGTTRFAGGASVFGILMVTDIEDSSADFHAVGTFTVYGAAVMDATMAQYQGTFQVVYVDNIVERALQTGGFGNVAGAWSDFHPVWQ